MAQGRRVIKGWHGEGGRGQLWESVFERVKAPRQQAYGPCISPLCSIPHGVSGALSPWALCSGALSFLCAEPCVPLEALYLTVPDPRVR